MSDQSHSKLYGFEAPPPPGVWDNIARELQESNAFLPLLQKMHHHEVPPPVAAWMHVFSALQKNDAPQTITLAPKGNSMVYKLLVAAIFTGVVLAGGIYFMSNSTVKKQLTGKLMGPKQNKNKPPLPKHDMAAATSRSPAIRSTQIGVNASGLVFNKRKINTVKKSSSRILRNAIVTVQSMLSMGNTSGVMIAASPIRNENGDIIQDLTVIHTPDKNYISVTGPNGEQTKISSKFLNVLLYMNGDTDIDLDDVEAYFDKAFFEGLSWKIRFKNWRKKIIQTPISPSSANLMDILEFKDLLLKENQ